MTRDEAWELLREHTKGDSLRKHGLAVEAAMRHFARKLGEDEETWAITGLLHDFDYERDPNGHPQNGKPILRAGGRARERSCTRSSRTAITPASRATTRDRRSTLYAVRRAVGIRHRGRARAAVEPEPCDEVDVPARCARR